MKNVTGIITLVTNEKVLQDLTHHRTLAAVPIGGRYRIIDFALSNMANSGIRDVGLFAQNKCGSLISHLGNGREWNLNRKRGGLFILPPDYSEYPSSMNKWDVSHFHSRLGYFQSRANKYLIISGCNMICNLDYRDAFHFHQKTNADVTIIYKKCHESEKKFFSSCFAVETDANGRVIDLRINPGQLTGSKVALEMFIMSKSLLISLIDDCITREWCDLVNDGLMANMKNLKIYGYPYQGYLAKINSLENFYRHNMDLLLPEVWEELFFRPGSIYTKVKDSAPAKYGADSSVKNSLVANDCVLEGKVENSVISRGVRIGRGAQVKNSIVLGRCVIGENALVNNVILDKEVLVSPGKILENKDLSPIVVKKRSVI